MRNIYDEMVKLQHSFNLKLDKDYLKKNWNWNSAIIAESGELLESLGYKWWLKCESPLSEKLRLNYYYKDGNIFNKKTNSAISSRFDKGTGYLLCANSDLCFNIGVNTIGLHRLIYMIHNGDIPGCADVDHIDKNKLNNNIKNLRLLNKRDNQLNSIKVEDAKGFYRVKNGKFQAQIRAENKKIYLGLFDTEKEASIAYESAKELYHKIKAIQAKGFKNCIDMDNVKVEAVDLLHFVISETIQAYYNCSHTKILEDVTDDFRNYFQEIETFEDFTNSDLEKLVSHLNYDTYDRFFIMKQIFKALNMSNEDVYIAYIIKNCLNQFRQDNGYKDGTYTKNWNGKEDNVVAYKLAKELFNSSVNLFDDLYIKLEQEYRYLNAN